MDKNEVKLNDTKGFNLLNNVSLFPHYTSYYSKISEEENKIFQEKFTKFLIDYSKNNKKVIAYSEEDTVFIDNNNIKLIGKLPDYIFENGIKKKIEID